MTPSRSFGIARPLIWMAFGTLFGVWVADAAWSTFYDWERQNRAAVVPELVELLREARAERAAEASKAERLLIALTERDECQVRYEAAQKELETSKAIGFDAPPAVWVGRNAVDPRSGFRSQWMTLEGAIDVQPVYRVTEDGRFQVDMRAR